MLRVATSADLPQIVAIYNATIPKRMSTADLEPVAVATRRPWFEAHTPEHPLWVEAEGEEVRAWLSLQPYKQRAGYRHTAEVSVYVHADHLREGLASRLLAEALQRAPELGLKTLIGVIFGHNAPSLRLFGRHGFVEWGRLPGVTDLDGVERDVVLYGRRVP